MGSGITYGVDSVEADRSQRDRGFLRKAFTPHQETPGGEQHGMSASRGPIPRQPPASRNTPAAVSASRSAAAQTGRRSARRQVISHQALRFWLGLLAGWISQTFFWQTVLSDPTLATQFGSSALYEEILQQLRVAIVLPGRAGPVIDVSFWGLGLELLIADLLLVCLAAAALRLILGLPFLFSCRTLLQRVVPWWLIPGGWAVGRDLCSLAGLNPLSVLLTASVVYLLAISSAGWIADSGGLLLREAYRRSQWVWSAADESRRTLSLPPTLWVAIGLYVSLFFAMNLGLWENLLVPHGDSAMYEEHLWNLLHGKGFRSYLDHGRLFLGEHVQVIHLLLIPLYLLWPSHLLLELAQSLALGLGAVWVYRLAARHSGSSTAAMLLAVGYLCYLPMQYLDIAIDFKTFRPNAFEIPLLLWALDLWDRRRRGWFGLAVLLTLLCQEDAAPVLAPLGVWIAATAVWSFIGSKTRNRTLTRSENRHRPGDLSRGGDRAREDITSRRHKLDFLIGCGLAIGSTVYLLLVLKVVLPYFRGGADVHYASYFSSLGHSTSEIVWNVITQPQLVLSKWLTAETGLFALALLVPLGGLSCLAPGRCLVAVPLFLVLSLNELSTRPVHHFHAPLIPILFWSAAAGLGSLPNWFRRWHQLRRDGFRVSWQSWRAASRWTTTSPAQPVPFEQRSTGEESSPQQPAFLRRSAERSALNRWIDPNAVYLTGRMLAPESIAHGDRSTRGAMNRPALSEHLWAIRAGLLALSAALITQCFQGLNPLSVSFWDPGSRGYWRALYLPNERARQARRLVAEIPQTARVASTDFIHPRFTHYERSYDYSDYRPTVPADAQYLVIDIRHPYSQVHSPDDIKELRERPPRWKLRTDDYGGYFYVLERIDAHAEQ